MKACITEDEEQAVRLRPSETEVLQLLLGGKVHYKEFCMALDKSYGAVVSIFSNMQERFGLSYKDKQGLREFALKRGLRAVTEFPKSPSQAGAVILKSEIRAENMPFVPGKPLLELKLVAPKPAEPVKMPSPQTGTYRPYGSGAVPTKVPTLTSRVTPTASHHPQHGSSVASPHRVEHEDSNASAMPGSEKAITLGRTLGEPFSANDVAARLDTARNGTPALSRAGMWLADWLQRGWIVNCGFRIYRRTEKFGDGK